jgi:predicted metalloprotease
MVRLGGEPESGTFEDRTGQSGGGIGLGGGGGGLGLLLSLVGSRFGIVGILVLLLGYCALTSLGGLGGLGGGSPGGSSGASKLDPNARDAMVRILGSTEQTWGEIFAKSGARYQPTTLVAYSGGTQTACGMGQAAMGPFYCPNDKKIYVDPDFFNELSQRFNAPGDFPVAYVIAHEVGHHIQDLEGTLDKAHNAQARAGEAGGNAIQVGVELQAAGSPLVMPRRSASMRCAELPCVKLSGTTAP